MLYFIESIISFIRIASRLSLKSRSRNGEDGARYLIIYKKLVLESLANEILNGGPRSRYFELIPPTEPIKRPTRMNNTNKMKNPMPKLPQQRNQMSSNAMGFNYNSRVKHQQKNKRFRRI